MAASPHAPRGRCGVTLGDLPALVRGAPDYRRSRRDTGPLLGGRRAGMAPGGGGGRGGGGGPWRAAAGLGGGPWVAAAAAAAGGGGGVGGGDCCGGGRGGRGQHDDGVEPVHGGEPAVRLGPPAGPHPRHATRPQGQVRPVPRLSVPSRLRGHWSVHGRDVRAGVDPVEAGTVGAGRAWRALVAGRATRPALEHEACA